MALNWTVLAPDGAGPLPLPDEKIFSSYEPVRLEFESGNGYPGAGGTSILVKRGKLFVTSHRLVYCAATFLDAAVNAARSVEGAASSSSGTTAPAPQACSSFQSLSVPLRSLHDTRLHDPWFGTKFVEMVVEPVPNGGLHIPGTAKFYFDQGGASEMYAVFSAILQRDRPDVVLTAPHRVPADEPLPLYSHPPSSGAHTAPAAQPPTPGADELPPSYTAPPDGAPAPTVSDSKRPIE
ncbi:hypothetical protein GGF31_003916 [Allomyces arbusculus]|nr:hypothetical protein GGF31_003916 [Allomyces arbusculus]